MTRTSYAIAIGSNRRGRHGGPEREVTAAIAALGNVSAQSRIIHTPPLGPSNRRFANAVVTLASDEQPPALLRRLKAIERDFGRRRGRIWGARVIDLDIILWSGGAWGDNHLIVPHPRFRERDFVLMPLLQVAPSWRDPMSGLSVRQLAARLRRKTCTR
ncbi:2-amino-4-hydroxy-6-hydroxymethyldihydropteridine diphosphokinase [Sphingomonas sp. JC676]|uniref:2-amino-4-hydroxy-6- hydroxymethyldihydropteridine diphosphokinase n=1 Tax=Sphingomonas sp. JC676 TaxID=2768065 RepID=UPI001657F98F|nr:2-amino-4-hydroxy-6-hydroxymethyldihydropteridine diphosphokinase [Sphingomonas sp. JC676]MBC9034082.1 2-amino-4-hydroxy-6-hydroxymethyldihydropteridine diphosphokinase [Sphingomonas sp. JC676]